MAGIAQRSVFAEHRSAHKARHGRLCVDCQLLTLAIKLLRVWPNRTGQGVFQETATPVLSLDMNILKVLKRL